MKSLFQKLQNVRNNVHEGISYIKLTLLRNTLDKYYYNKQINNKQTVQTIKQTNKYRRWGRRECSCNIVSCIWQTWRDNSFDLSSEINNLLWSYVDRIAIYRRSLFNAYVANLFFTVYLVDGDGRIGTVDGDLSICYGVDGDLSICYLP